MWVLIILFIFLIVITIFKKSEKKENNQKEIDSRYKEIRNQEIKNNFMDASFYPQTINDAKMLSEIIINDVINEGKSSSSRIYSSVCYFCNGKIYFKAPNYKMRDEIDYRLLGYDFKQDSCHMYSEMVGKLIKEFAERKCKEVFVTYDIDDNVGYSNYGDFYYVLNIIVEYPIQRGNTLKMI